MKMCPETNGAHPTSEGGSRGGEAGNGDVLNDDSELGMVLRQEGRPPRGGLLYARFRIFGTIWSISSIISVIWDSLTWNFRFHGTV